MNEQTLFTTLSPLVSGRVYPDLAEFTTEKPYITYQQVGGRPINYIEAIPSDKKHVRLQINVWATTRLEAMMLIRNIEDTLVQSMQATVESAPVAEYEPAIQLRGARQDFSFMFKDS